MRRFFLVLGLWMLTGGCAAARAPLPESWVQGAREGGRPQTNLLFGGAPRDLDAANDGMLRSNWPAYDVGYRYNETSEYFEIFSDNQYAFDRHQSLFRGAQSIRSGVLIR